MPHGSLEEEKLRSALHIIQRIFQDAWLIEERSVLQTLFHEQFSCSDKELEVFFADFFHPQNLSSISIREEQAQQKRFSLQDRVQPNFLFFRDVIRRHGASFVLQIVDIVIALLLKKGKSWDDILHSFSQLVLLGVEPLLVMALYQRSNLMHTQNLLKDILYVLLAGRIISVDMDTIPTEYAHLHTNLLCPTKKTLSQDATRYWTM